MVVSSLTPSTALLKEVKLFQAFSEGELQSILQMGTSSSFEPYANIVIEGELSWGLYLILSGVVGIFKTNKLTGDSFDVAQLQTGNFFGEMSLVDGNPRSATVRTLTQSVLFFISKDSFTQFLDQSSDLKMRFFNNCVANLVGRLRQLDDDYVISQYQLWQTALMKEKLQK
jgi:CRP/FNR family transcriptional regulator, cyclic AMP receptor protein